MKPSKIMPYTVLIFLLDWLTIIKKWNILDTSVLNGFNHNYSVTKQTNEWGKTLKLAVNAFGFDFFMLYSANHIGPHVASFWHC